MLVFGSNSLQLLHITLTLQLMSCQHCSARAKLHAPLNADLLCPGTLLALTRCRYLEGHWTACMKHTAEHCQQCRQQMKQSSFAYLNSDENVLPGLAGNRRAVFWRDRPECVGNPKNVMLPPQTKHFDLRSPPQTWRQGAGCCSELCISQLKHTAAKGKSIAVH